jgi:hypothetical protein
MRSVGSACPGLSGGSEARSTRLRRRSDRRACPLDDIIKKNLRFLIGIRHEIEHQMTRRIDDQLSARPADPLAR